MRSFLALFFCCLIIFLFISSANAENKTIHGKVIDIIDGDSLIILDATNKQFQIRLAEIDAPEHDQPYGHRAREELSYLTLGKDLRVEIQTIDKKGRNVGKVFAGEFYVNGAMVATGAAWVYRQYSDDPRLLETEKIARQDNQGLWSIVDPVEPWEWRRGERKPKPEYKTPDAEEAFRATAKCGNKYYCGEMSSCAEAQFYYRSCGLSRLDEDNDGIPCEVLCGYGAPTQNKQLYKKNWR